MAVSTAAASRTDWALSKLPKSNPEMAQVLNLNLFSCGFLLLSWKNCLLQWRLDNEWDRGFEKGNLALYGEPEMGNFELVNLIKENEEKDGEEYERFTITMVPSFVCVFFFF